MSALLEVRGLTRRFGGLTAVKNVSFAIAGGELTGVLGPNGAGKTTLFNLLTGFVAPDAGEVRFAGADITGLARHRIVSCGMARTFQQPRPFRLMTVEENVAVACLSPRGRQQPGCDKCRLYAACRDPQLIRRCQGQSITKGGLLNLCRKRLIFSKTFGCLRIFCSRRRLPGRSKSIIPSKIVKTP